MGSLSIERFYEMLIELLDQLSLDDPDAANAMSAVDPDLLTDDHRTKLDAIYRHCCVEEGLDDPKGPDPLETPMLAERRENGGPGITASRGNLAKPAQRRGTARKAEMMRLSRDVHVPESLQRLLSNPEIRAAPQLLLHYGNIPLCDVDGPIVAKDIGGAFHSCYDLILCLKDRSVVDKLIWTFLMKWMYNLVRLLDPKYSGRRFSANMKKVFTEFVRENFQDSTSQNEASENADKWSRCGLKINQLCTEFGSGCIFYLARHFSEDFFENKYRETGKTKDTVFSELHAAGLGRLVAESGANEVCDAVDKYLIDGFREFFADRLRRRE